MPKVADLTASEAANVARKILYTTFEVDTPRKFLYHALTLDKHCPEAQILLTKIIEVDTNDLISLTIKECSYEIAKDPEVKSRINLNRRVTLARLGLLQVPPEHTDDLSADEFYELWQNSPDFVEDRESVEKIVQKTLAGRTLEQAYDAACLLVGVRSGLVVPIESTPKEVAFEDCFDGDSFKRSDDYNEFLSCECVDHDE